MPDDNRAALRRELRLRESAPGVRSPAFSDRRGVMSDDWTTDAVDNIERVVATVRGRTVVPAQNVTRAIVFGLLTAFFVLAALTIVSIGLFRLVDIYVPAGVWATYLIFGGIFAVAGTFCWAQRTKVPRSA